jgi:hypothetical protein
MSFLSRGGKRSLLLVLRKIVKQIRVNVESAKLASLDKTLSSLHSGFG